MQGNSAVHIAFNRSMTSSLANRFYHLSGFGGGFFSSGKKVAISQLYPSVVSRPMIIYMHHLSSRVYSKYSACSDMWRVKRYYCTLVSGKRISYGRLVPGVHLFQGQSLDPVPRPLPLPFTHLRPAIPVPASLGMKSQTRLPVDCSVERPSREEILKCPLWETWCDDSRGLLSSI